MRPRQVLAGALSAVAAAGGAALLISGSALCWAHLCQRDSDGFYRGRTQFLTAPTALTSTELDFGGGLGYAAWNPIGRMGTLRVTVERLDDGPVFVGIADRGRVATYLEEADPVNEPPSDQTWWMVHSEGEGARTIWWELDDEPWTAVVMNDAEPGPVEVLVRAELRTDALLFAGVALAGAGAVAEIAAARGIAVARGDDGSQEDEEEEAWR